MMFIERVSIAVGTVSAGCFVWGMGDVAGQIFLTCLIINVFIVIGRKLND